MNHPPARSEAHSEAHSEASAGPSGGQGGWAAAAAGALVAEAWLFTWGRGALGAYGSGVALALVGLLASFGTYRCWRGRPWVLPTTPALPAPTAAVWLAAALGAAACALGLAATFRRCVVSIAFSDIIPALSIYPRRWLAGEVVYRPFTDELGYAALPTYLPATWAPYVVPEVLRFDYRWMAFGVFLAGVAALLRLLWRLRLPALPSFGLALWPFVLLLAVRATDEQVLGHTVESMIVGYYLLLAVGLLLGGRGALVTGLLLCLLSRFALVLWVPLLLALLAWQRGHREALLVAGLVALGVAGLYVLPFLSHDWGLFWRVQRSYTDVAVGEWNHLNEHGLPYHLYNGIGLGNLLYAFGSGTKLAKILLLKNIQLATLLGMVLGAALAYGRAPRPRTDYRVFAVVSLKAYLVLFYALLQVPYAYLALVSLFTSCVLLLLLARGSRGLATAALTPPVR